VCDITVIILACLSKLDDTYLAQLITSIVIAIVYTDVYFGDHLLILKRTVGQLCPLSLPDGHSVERW